MKQKRQKRPNEEILFRKEEIRPPPAKKRVKIIEKKIKSKNNSLKI